MLLARRVSTGSDRGRGRTLQGLATFRQQCPAFVLAQVRTGARYVDSGFSANFQAWSSRICRLQRLIEGCTNRSDVPVEGGRSPWASYGFSLLAIRCHFRSTRCSGPFASGRSVGASGSAYVGICPSKAPSIACSKAAQPRPGFRLFRPHISKRPLNPHLHSSKQTVIPVSQRPAAV